MSEQKNAYMYGLGVLKTLGLAFRHFLETYLDDIRHGVSVIELPEGIAYRSSKDVRGIFTVQYPEEKLPVPEEFRYIPFLVYEEKDGKIEYRCTSCGICRQGMSTAMHLDRTFN